MTVPYGKNGLDDNFCLAMIKWQVGYVLLNNEKNIIFSTAGPILLNKASYRSINKAFEHIVSGLSQHLFHKIDLNSTSEIFYKLDL